MAVTGNCAWPTTANAIVGCARPITEAMPIAARSTPASRATVRDGRVPTGAAVKCLILARTAPRRGRLAFGGASGLVDCHFKYGLVDGIELLFAAGLRVVDARVRIHT